MKGKACGCGCHGVDQGALLDFLLRTLRDAVLEGGKLEALRDRICQRLRARQHCKSRDSEALMRRVNDLDAQLAQGVKRLLQVPDNLADLLALELSTLRNERDRLAADLADMDRSVVTNVEAEADRIASHISKLSGDLCQKKTEPARLREVLRRMVSRIELTFNHVQRGKRMECPISKGTIHLRPDELMFRLVNRGDRI